MTRIFLNKEPCPKCRENGFDAEGDNLGRYSDGYGKCFVAECGYYEYTKTNEVKLEPKKSMGLIDTGQCAKLDKRSISKKTCEFFGYQVGEYNGSPVHIANYYDSFGNIVAQKLRFPDKSFCWKGDAKKAQLFGQHKWNPNEKIPVVITEGEIDALSIAEIQDCKYPVVSIANGAQSAELAIRANIDWLSKFKNVVLCFDNDEAGAKAVENCSKLFPIGKLRIAKIPLKDANEMLVMNRIKELQLALMNAEEFAPDEIVVGTKLDRNKVFAKEDMGYTLPYPMLNEMIRGAKKKRLALITAGSGIGKSSFLKEIAYKLFTDHGKELKIAHIFLEESMEQTALSYIALDKSVPYYLLSEDKDFKLVSEQGLNESYDKLFEHDKVFLYKHFGSMDYKVMLNRLEYLTVGKQVDFIFLDHISMVVSGSESGKEGERKDIDMFMTTLRTLVERTGVGIYAAVHLKRKEGKSFNKGKEVQLSDMKGSSSLEQLSDFVIGLERDTQDESDKNTLIVRVLKNRLSGVTGIADTLYYNSHTGRLKDSL